MGDPGVGDDDACISVTSRTTRSGGRAGGRFPPALQNILNVNLTLDPRHSETSNARSEEVKIISASAAVLFAPTLVGTV